MGTEKETVEYVSHHDEELSSHDSLSDDKLQEVQNDHATYTNGFARKKNIQDDYYLYYQSRYKKMYDICAYGHMCKICEVFYGESPVPTGKGRGGWIHSTVIFHGNAGKKLQHHAESKPHTNTILAIT